ncbi:MAG: alpha/beta hydrolase [Candidatus Binatia bacterium]
MPFVEIPGARLWYAETGQGIPLVCLHSGWGRGAMPFDDAAQLLGPTHRLIFPDRRGFGRSTPLDELPVQYHRDGAVDLGHFLDAMSLERVALWGHSDGAIIAALFAADHAERVPALVLEAIHFHRAKSPEFFAQFAADPDALSPQTIERLRADHGERWRTVVAMHSRVWLAFHEIGGDFYEGRLERVACPALVLYGEGDPHTPPSEVAELGRHLRHATLQPVAEGGHSPHSESKTARFCSERVLDFLSRHDL